MHVAGEDKQVEAGTLVLIPAGAPHSIRNVGAERLVYISATSPPLDQALIDSLYEP